MRGPGGVFMPNRQSSLKSFAHMAVAAQVGCSWCLDVGYFQAQNQNLADEMLGSEADAEDVLQESWLRWADVDRTQVRDPRSYLIPAAHRAWACAFSAATHGRYQHQDDDRYAADNRGSGSGLCTFSQAASAERRGRRPAP